MIMSTAEATQERINVQAGEYDGDVGEYLGLDGDAGEVGEYFGLVGEYLGLVGLICAGLVGESKIIISTCSTHERQRQRTSRRHRAETRARR